MWMPQDASEVEEVIGRGDLEETSSFDGKANLPTPKRNADLAIDVAAMSTEGGVLLYGVAEDENKRLTLLEPIELAGVGDRIGQIVATSITEVPYIEVREHPLPEDSSKGYVSVLVPQSARAPHQVSVGDDRRFYGRGAKGNRRLNEGEIARLYQRRSAWEQDRDALLGEAVQQAPYGPQNNYAYLHGFARPVMPSQAIWDRAIASAGGQQELQNLLADAASAARPSDGYSPNLRPLVWWNRQGADEWRMSSSHNEVFDDSDDAGYLVAVRMNVDGRGHLFCGRAAERIVDSNRIPPRDPTLVIFETLIAGNSAAFLAAMGRLYEVGGYQGHVDIGLILTGLRGGFSSTRLGRPFPFDDVEPYNADTYPRTERVSAGELSQSEEVVRRMLRHLFEATTGRDDFDVLSLES